MSDLEPLDPELADLFAHEPIPAPPPDATARVFERLLTSAAVGPVLAGATPLAARLGRRAIPLAMTTFALGAVVGAGAVVLLGPREPRVVYVERAAPHLSAVRAEELTVSPYSLPSVLDASKPPSAPSASAPHDTLKEERAIIEEARSKLASGDVATALQRLDEHARRYAKARLAEEREALAIQALVNVQRYDEARTRAASFRDRWPSSVYLPAVEITLRSIP